MVRRRQEADDEDNEGRSHEKPWRDGRPAGAGPISFSSRLLDGQLGDVDPLPEGLLDFPGLEHLFDAQLRQSVKSLALAATDKDGLALLDEALEGILDVPHGEVLARDPVDDKVIHRYQLIFSDRFKILGFPA